jgi:hypothetical protein
MERNAMQSLIAWKQSPYRKPLIRQVGKTWVLREFGRRYYERVAYFNFDEHPEYQQFFESTKDVTRILDNFQFIIGFPITEGTTLIIFDEIQEAPNVLNALKYFHENGKAYHVALLRRLAPSLIIPHSFIPHDCSPSSRVLLLRRTYYNLYQHPFPNRYVIGPAVTTVMKLILFCNIRIS